MTPLFYAARRLAAASESQKAHASMVADTLAVVCKRSSQRKVAKALGLSPQYVNDIIRRRRIVSDDLVSRLLHAESIGIDLS